MKIRVADYIVKFLYEKGVKHVFTVSGGGAMYLNDALACHKKMQYICNHHEQACTFAAENYSRVTNNFGAAMVTTGPGATNAITGVHEAWVDSTPLMIISGQSKKKETIANAKIAGLRQFGVFEVNIIPMIAPITKFSVMINEPEKIKYYLEKAFYLAKTGRPGPVWIDVPLDVQGALIEESSLTGYTPDQTITNEFTNSQLKSLITLLKSSKKPVIIAGNGIRIAGAIKEFEELVKKLRIPVVTSIMGTDVIAETNPYFVGRVGLRGQRSGNLAVQNADLIISIGSRLSIPIIGYEYAKFAPHAKKVVIDIDPVEHKKKTISIDLLFTTDAKKFITTVLKNSENSTFIFKKDWLKKCKELKDRYPVCLPEYIKAKNSVNMYYLVDKISDAISSKDVVIADAGSAFYVVRQAIKVKKGQRVLIAGGTGAMGVNLPACLGASIGLQKRRVICITGDGSFQTNIHELQTISFHKLPVKIFVLNNNGYLSIKNTQNNFFNNRHMGVDENSGVSLPQTAKIAKAYGIAYFKIKNNNDLVKNLPLVLQKNEPVICEVMCPVEQQIIPTVSSKKLPDGTLVSTSIDDMYPFLTTEEMNKIKKDLQ